VQRALYVRFSKLNPVLSISALNCMLRFLLFLVLTEEVSPTVHENFSVLQYLLERMTADVIFTLQYGTECRLMPTYTSDKLTSSASGRC
jgi:hypothetical protein